MCRNHSHAVVARTEMHSLPDGTVVTIAELEHEEFTLEHSAAGGKLTLPQCSTLLILSQLPDMHYYSPEALMAGLWALWSVGAANVTDFTPTTSTKSELPF